MKQSKWKVPSPQKNKLVEIELENKDEIESFKKVGFLIKKTDNGKIILEKKFKKWELFQERVRILLEILGFDDIESGYNSWLGRYQIDAVGGKNGTLLVVECKSADQPKKKSIANEIDIFKGKQIEINKAIAEKYGSKYNEVRYVLVVDDIDIDPKDIETARVNDVYLWCSRYIDVLERLYKVIGSLTFHYVLKELNCTPKYIKDEEGSADYKVPSFKVTIGDQEIFSFYIPVEKLLNLVYVFRLQSGNEDAYQRFINEKRIFGTTEEPGIAEYIDNGGFFKNNVVCSFEKQVTFEPKNTGLLLQDTNMAFGILSIPKIYGSVWIIDGQHRIYGYTQANTEKLKYCISVTAYQDIGKKQQARDFIDINQKQKSVDPNLLWDLLSQTDPNSIQGAITKIAKELNKTGYFKGKILIPRHQQRKASAYPLKLANICNTLYDRKIIDPLVKGTYNLYQKNGEVSETIPFPDSILVFPEKVINEYFTLIDSFAEEYHEWKKGFILHNNGFNIFTRVLVEVLQYFKGVWDKRKVEDLIKEPIIAFFLNNYSKIKEYRAMTSNEAGRANIALMIIETINKSNELFAIEYIKDIEKRKKMAYQKSEPYNILKDLEVNLRTFVETKLNGISSNWWNERIPSDVKENAEDRHSKKENIYPWAIPEEKSKMISVDFPDYYKIIARRDNWEEVFKEVFSSKELFYSKFIELQSIRNKIAHSDELTAEEAMKLRLHTHNILDTIQKNNRQEE